MAASRRNNIVLRLHRRLFTEFSSRSINAHIDVSHKVNTCAISYAAASITCTIFLFLLVGCMVNLTVPSTLLNIV